VELVDEIAGTKEDVQQGGVMAALTIVAVVIAMASLSPSLALWRRRAATRSEHQRDPANSSHGVHTFLPLGFQGLGF
jgi:hypothetical protein